MKRVVLTALIFLLSILQSSLSYAYLRKFKMGMTYQEVYDIIKKDRLVVVPYNLSLKEMEKYIFPEKEPEEHPYATYPPEIKITYLFNQAPYLIEAPGTFRFIFSPRTKLLSIINIEWNLYEYTGYGHQVRNRLSLWFWKAPEKIGDKNCYVWSWEGPSKFHRVYLNYEKTGKIILQFYGHKYYEQLLEEIEAMKAEFDSKDKVKDIK
jgi:hypothetical protein